MENREVTKKEETELLSNERLKAKNAELEKRVTTLENQIKDMINELKSGSYNVISEDSGSNSGTNKDELDRKVKKVFGNGKIN